MTPALFQPVVGGIIKNYSAWQGIASGAAPTSWTDLDCSSVVGANAVTVMLAIRNDSGDATAEYWRVRDNGHGDETVDGTAGTVSTGIGDTYITYLQTTTDTNGKAEIICNVAKNYSMWIMSYYREN